MTLYEVIKAKALGAAAVKDPYAAMMAACEKTTVYLKDKDGYYLKDKDDFYLLDK